MYARWQQGIRAGTRWGPIWGGRRVKRYAKLTPYVAGALGMWPLGDLDGYTAFDRSGNGRDLGAYTGGSGAVVVPDLRPQFVALTRGTGTATPPTRTDAALRLLGELTLTCRFWVGASNPARFAACEGATSELEAENTLYSLGMTGQKLTYLAERNAGVDITFTATTLIRFGQWYFAALRRSASGVVRLTLGDFSSNVHETSGVLDLPTGGTNAVFKIGPALVSQAVVDVCLWGYELTDDVLETIRWRVMGQK